ncbi:hypothetical protein A9Q84_12130 [Halobacteriovorax marinus]|uniref:Uncharacterized protein n=1 Tax=Halobacteriovorax marinus TaxID=97084 RepID=A0A1Y5FEQ9_9BACT|nr:hypothetical protein A9Q84_12130 [Halobacteriovorax marinus]
MEIAVNISIKYNLISPIKLAQHLFRVVRHMSIFGHIWTKVTYFYKLIGKCTIFSQNFLFFFKRQLKRRPLAAINSTHCYY